MVTTAWFRSSADEAAAEGSPVSWACSAKSYGEKGDRVRMLRTNRRLLLLRHGKAESPLGVADADRPLAPRGRAQSGYAGREAKERGLVPDLVVVSAALRARQTWAEFAAAAAAYALGGGQGRSADSDHPPTLKLRWRSRLLHPRWRSTSTVGSTPTPWTTCSTS